MENVVLGRNKTVLDLFCGAGGLSIGFEEAGFDVVEGVDFDENALETWEANHEDGNATNLNLAETSPAELTEALSVDADDIDVVIGGPPCKDFTKANQKIDLGRNNLVVLFAEFVSHIQPDAFLIENVRQLTTKYEEVLDAVYDTLQDDYSIDHRLLDSADYGAPQHRVRAFVLGVQKEYPVQANPKFPLPTHGPDSNSDRPLRTAGEVLDDIEPPANDKDYEVTSQHAHLLPDIPPGMNYSFYTEKLGHPEPEFDWRSRFSDYLYKTDPEKPVRTIKAKPGAASGPFHWDNRRFTEEELKRLQSFPDDFEFTCGYSEVMRLIGNSVPPAQAYALAEAIEQQIEEDVDLMAEDEELDFHSRRRTPTEEYQKKAAERLEELGLVDSADTL